MVKMFRVLRKGSFSLCHGHQGEPGNGTLRFTPPLLVVLLVFFSFMIRRLFRLSVCLICQLQLSYIDRLLG